MEVEREFQHLDIPAMESVLDRYDWNEELAGRMLVELATRRDNSEAARKIRARLMSFPRVREFAQSPPPGEIANLPNASAGTDQRVRLNLLAGQVATVRPVGTPNLPVAKTTMLDCNFTLSIAPDAPRSTRYRVALDEYISEKRKSRQGNRRSIRNGRRTSPLGTPHLYEFEVSKTEDIPAGAEVEVLIAGRSIKGTVRTTTLTEVSLEIESDIGAKIPKAQLRLDDTKLLQKLRDRICAVEHREIEFNVALADAAVGAGTAQRVEPIPEPGFATALNASQLEALRHVLNHALTFIWGPPGCGKTKTLGEIVRSAFGTGKRMLICSNTNKAVDQVLYSICNALGKEHPAMQSGQIVRLGAIADPKLAGEFGDCIDIDRIVERLAAQLRIKLNELQAKISEVEREVATVSDVLRRFAELDAAQRGLNEATGSRRRFECDAVELQRRLAENDQRMIQLADELTRGHGWLRIFRRSVEEVTKDLDVARALRAQIENHQAENREAEESAARIEDAANSEYLRLSASVAGEDRATCETRLRELTQQLDALKKDGDAIEKELADLRARVMREARVIGATGTRVYLTPKEIGLLDLVIIDETSMLLQPMIWVAAGLSRERVVLCGDFRQLPPIVSTERQAIFDLVGRDVFDAAGVSALDVRDERMVMLDTQYRMDEAICALITDRMYAGRLRTTTDPEWRRQRAGWPRPPPPFDGALTLIDTSALRCAQAFEDGSRFNLAHALLVRNLAHHLTQKGFASEPKALAVCTPYKAHARLISQILKEESLDHVQVGTAHTFQGDERNAVIVDFPEGHGSDIGRFLKGTQPKDASSRLINVAVSRAQNHLIVMANLELLDARLPSDSILRGVLWDMQRNGRVLPATELLKVGPRERDLEGLETIQLDDPARRFGVFNSQTFDCAFASDVARARKSIAIFSGFVSRYRVGELKVMLQGAVQDNVKVRCVSKPPHKNFPRDPASGAEAFDTLESIGCVVDGRGRVHEKVVIIDQRILWHGSLNVLSFCQLTDELMTRTVSVEAARSVALMLAKRAVAPEKALEVVADPENSWCGGCGSRSFYDEDRGATYFVCERNCGWRESLSGPHGAVRGREEHGNHKGIAPSAKVDSEVQPTEASMVFLKTAARPYPDRGPPCPKCESPTQCKRNSKKNIFFYGCSRFKSHGCRGTLSIPAELRGEGGNPAIGSGHSGPFLPGSHL